MANRDTATVTGTTGAACPCNGVTFTGVSNFNLDIDKRLLEITAGGRTSQIDVRGKRTYTFQVSRDGVFNITVS